MGKKEVVCKQQLSDGFLNGSCVREEMPNVQEIAVCSKMDVDAIWQVLFCLMKYDAEENGEQCGGQNASLLNAIEDGEAARQRPFVHHLTLLTFMEESEKFWGQPRHARIFQSITADSIKGLGQVYESCIQTYVLFSVFLLYPPQHEDHVGHSSVGPEPTLAFWHVFLCYVRMSLLSKMHAKILPAMESRVMPQ